MSELKDILVIDDEKVVADAVIKICALEDYNVEVASNVKQAKDKILNNRYEIIICDIMMPDGDGFQVLDLLQSKNIESAMIMMTGYSTVENAVNSLYQGAIDFIPKPFTVDELLSAVFRANRYQQIKRKQKQSHENNSRNELFYVDCPTKYFRLGHSSWLFKERDGSVLIGICDLFLKTIDSVTEIEFQDSETEIAQGISCVTIKSGDSKVHKVHSPISGKIIRVNEALKRNPSLIEKDPYFEGWIYRAIPEDFDFESKKLIPCSSDRT